MRKSFMLSAVVALLLSQESMAIKQLQQKKPVGTSMAQKSPVRKNPVQNGISKIGGIAKTEGKAVKTANIGKNQVSLQQSTMAAPKSQNLSTGFRRANALWALGGGLTLLGIAYYAGWLFTFNSLDLTPIEENVEKGGSVPAGIDPRFQSEPRSWQQWFSNGKLGVYDDTSLRDSDLNANNTALALVGQPNVTTSTPTQINENIPPQDDKAPEPLSWGQWLSNKGAGVPSYVITGGKIIGPSLFSGAITLGILSRIPHHSIGMSGGWGAAATIANFAVNAGLHWFGQDPTSYLSMSISGLAMVAPMVAAWWHNYNDCNALKQMMTEDVSTLKKHIGCFLKEDGNFDENLINNREFIAETMLKYMKDVHDSDKYSENEDNDYFTSGFKKEIANYLSLPNNLVTFKNALKDRLPKHRQEALLDVFTENVRNFNEESLASFLGEDGTVVNEVEYLVNARWEIFNPETKKIFPKNTLTKYLNVGENLLKFRDELTIMLSNFQKERLDDLPEELKNRPVAEVGKKGVGIENKEEMGEE